MCAIEKRSYPDAKFNDQWLEDSISSTTHPVSFFRRWCRIFSDLDGLQTEKTHQWVQFVCFSREQSKAYHKLMTNPAATTTTSKEKREITAEPQRNWTAEIRLIRITCTHLNPQEMLCIQPSGSFLSRATFDVCALTWAVETDAETEGYAEGIAGANERAHPEQRFITAAIVSACWVISLRRFASVCASLSGW